MTTPANAVARPVTPVGIATKQLQACLESCRANLGQVIDDKLVTQLEVACQPVIGLETYVEQNTSPASTALQALAQRTADQDWSVSFDNSETSILLEQEMLSGAVEGEFLKMLVRVSKRQSILEIGMFTGYGTLAMAEAVAPSGHVVALELDPFAAQFAQQSFDESGMGDCIEVMVGDANESLEKLNADRRQFDFVFLDADKAGYRTYIETLLDSNLLTDDALICVDNTLLQGEPYLDESERTASGQAIADFNLYVASRRDLHHVLVPIRDGVTLIQRVTAVG
ncbi:MAG: class I SAM-dependent methyltransferase [Planctomycetota bacterium]